MKLAHNFMGLALVESGSAWRGAAYKQALRIGPRMHEAWVKHGAGAQGAG